MTAEQTHELSLYKGILRSRIVKLDRRIQEAIRADSVRFAIQLEDEQKILKEVLNELEMILPEDQE